MKFAVVAGFVVLWLIAFGGALGLVVRRLRRWHAEALEAARARFGTARVRRSAQVNGFGLESRGRWQARGNGTLVLLDDRLWFRLYVPAREVEIPLASVVRAETVSSHLGKWVGKPLLRVTFRGGGGGEDAAAWLVADPETWIAEIRAASGPRAGA